MRTRKLRSVVIGAIAIVVSFGVFVVPFIFIALQAMKSTKEAAALSFALPTHWHFLANLQAVIANDNGVILRAFVNSAILTVCSVVVMVVLAAAAGYVIQRQRRRWNAVMNFFVLAGLIIPPAVIPTIWLLQGLHLYKTLPGMILIEATYGMSFCIILFRGFISTIPRELDEAAVMDGASPLRLFVSIILPLLRPVVITAVIVQSVGVFNDFAGPLYFLPGDSNATVQLTLYNFAGRNDSQYNLLFMDILLITIPPLIMYLFFNKQIAQGMTSGAVKG